MRDGRDGWIATCKSWVTVGRVLGWTLIGWAGAHPASCQIQTGEIFGTVRDETSAAMPKVEVTLNSPALIQPLSGTTAASGAYRFPNIPIGTYDVAFEHPDFRRLVRQGVRVTAGFGAEVNVRFETAGFAESLLVTGESPMIDRGSTAICTTFSRDYLESVPSARDPWSILAQTPSVILDRESVGGSLAGRQLVPMGHGSYSYTDNMWNLDGVTLTDMFATGASPVFFDFEAFEQIYVQTGGHDASVQTGGINVNLLTKSGGDAFKGSSRLYVSDGELQADNISAELRAQGAGAGAPIHNLKDYGLEIGGPLARERVWFWGSYGRQDIRVGVLGFLRPGATDPYDPDSLATTRTVIENRHLKIQGQWQVRHKTTFHYGHADRVEDARGASPIVALEATQRFEAPVPTYALAHQWTATPRLSLELRGSYVGGNSVFDFHRPELESVQAAYDAATGMTTRSGNRYGPYDRPTTELKVDGYYFLPGFLGGDHAARFGVRFRDTPFVNQSHAGGNATALFDDGLPYRADLHRDGREVTAMSAWSVYLSDSYSRGRWRLNVGARADYQDDAARPASIAANPIIPDLLPALEFEGADSGVEFLDVSPRLGLIYDVRGHGKTLLKVSAARYYGQGIYTASTLDPVTPVTLSYAWDDRNGDRFIQRDELDLSQPLKITGTYDPRAPGSPTSSNRVDPNFKNDRTGEITVGIDHQVTRNLTLTADYLWRRYDRPAWTPRIGLSSSDFFAIPFTEECGNDTCGRPVLTGVTYGLPFPLPTAKILTHRDYHRSHRELRLTAYKHFSDRWMLFASLTLNDTRVHYDSERGYQDPTNVALTDGEQIARSRWVVRLSGMADLAWGIRASAFLNMREGFPFNPLIRSPDRGNGLGRAAVMIEPSARSRHQDLATLDGRFEKSFVIGVGKKLAVSLEVFNLTNADTVLRREARQDRSTANLVRAVLAPRLVRLGIRLSF